MIRLLLWKNQNILMREFSKNTIITIEKASSYNVVKVSNAFTKYNIEVIFFLIVEFSEVRTKEDNKNTHKIKRKVSPNKQKKDKSIYNLWICIGNLTYSGKLVILFLVLSVSLLECSTSSFGQFSVGRQCHLRSLISVLWPGRWL